MPFKKGAAPLRRTMEYLHAGKIKLHKSVAVVATNYNVDQKSSVGAYEFVFWHYPQLVYHNQHVQFLKFKNMTPTPAIQILCRIKGEKNFVVDCYDRTREEIHNHVLETFGVENYSGKQGRQIWNPAGFGYRCRHWCICELPGQVPCPSYTELPRHLRGKYRHEYKDKTEES